jgi:hypothetical protein
MLVHDLRSLWEKVFGYQAPATAKSTFLRRAIARKIQVKAFGGVKPETHKLLLRIAKDPSLARSPKVSDAVPEIKPGTRLLRSWDGETHEVAVTPARLSMARPDLEKSVPHCPGNYRDELVRPYFLWSQAREEAEVQHCRGRRWPVADPTTRKSGCAVPSIPANLPRKASNRNSTPSMPNGRPAKHISCEAHIKSQKSEGWSALTVRYDDGGYSGGNLDRPALLQLLQDIKAHKIDVVVVYKIDRLTRSLMDFSKIVEVLTPTRSLLSRLPSSSIPRPLWEGLGNRRRVSIQYGVSFGS